MKKFTFSLERVLAWRRSQARLEELKLERLRADRHALEARRKFLAGESSRTLSALLRASPVTGGDLEALDRFRKSTAVQAARLDGLVRDLDGQIAAQTEAVSSRRRDVKLIDQLREKKLQTWRRAFLKEIDQQAEESHLARFARFDRLDGDPRGA
jgi:hypothetical protein